MVRFLKQDISFKFAASVIFVTGLLVSTALVYAINIVAEGFQVMVAENKQIEAHNICRKVENGTGTAPIFVPTKALNEWMSVASNSNLRSDIRVTNCAGTNCRAYAATGGPCGTKVLTWAPLCSANGQAKAYADANWPGQGISSADLAVGKAAIDTAQGSLGTIDLCNEAHSVEEKSGTYQGWSWTATREFECSNAPNNQGPVYTISVTKDICY